MEVATEPKVITGISEQPGPGLNKWHVTTTIPGAIKNGLRRSVIAKSHQQAKKLYIEYNARCNGNPEWAYKRYKSLLDAGSIKAKKVNLTLRPYFVTDQPGEWAILVFHYSSQEARVAGWNEWPCTDLPGDAFLYVRATRADDRFMKFAKSNIPHVVDTYSGDFETWEDALKNLEAQHAS